VSWQRPIETLETNIIGTANVLETVRRLDTDVRVVVAGSSAE
jgi:GDP-4-dehydro-6-deoxy-D-mannose reductase